MKKSTTASIVFVCLTVTLTTLVLFSFGCQEGAPGVSSRKEYRTREPSRRHIAEEGSQQHSSGSDGRLGSRGQLPATQSRGPGQAVRV